VAQKDQLAKAQDLTFTDIPSMIIVTKKQTTAETVIPAKLCTQAMETWM
jgi:hypothetical protein